MAQRRVLFFGLDGYDPAVGNALIAEGRLPAMAPMRRTGGHTGGPGMLLVVGPGIEPGYRGLASTFDVTPAVISLVGRPVPAGLSGRPLPLQQAA